MEKKKRVLHVSAGGLGHGGVSTVIFSIVESLHEQFDFSCVVFNRKLERESLFEKYGTLHRIDCYPKKGKRNYFELIKRPFKLYFGIRKICKKEHIDIIHCHNQRDEWIGLLAAKHACVPIRIAHSHNTNSPRKISAFEKAYKKISPIMLNRVATAKTGCSKSACEDFFSDNQFIVIPNSVNFDKYSTIHKEKHDGTVFIHVGRFTYQKNQEFVIATFAEICKELEDVRLFLVGFGEESEIRRLNDLIEHLGLSGRVEILPGDQVDVASIYAKSDYMIFPSRFEGFGIVLIEAQAMDIQCYVSENIQPEVNLGLLTFLNLSDGPQKWAERIVQDIKNGTRGNCDQELLSQYSERVICKRYAELYSG